MNKELKALEDIILYLNANEPKGLYCKNIEIIKNALKRIDSIEITAIDIEQENQALCKENKKLKQALEIIKEKRVNVDYLIRIDFDLERYNRFIAPFHRYDLNAMEITILKEVLL